MDTMDLWYELNVVKLYQLCFALSLLGCLLVLWLLGTLLKKLASWKPLTDLRNWWRFR